jgi:sigma-B regulation protein RsbU (phosphoserine phosphatase)
MTVAHEPNADPETDPAAAHSLQCMEIWGGNQIVDHAVATPGLDIWVYSRPHARAADGGDVYYASLCGGGTLTRLILADVCGHGPLVADVARGLRALMRKHINRKAQDRLVRSLNQEFAALADCGRFATAVVATYLTKTNRLTVSNAGHPRPLWYAAEAGRWSLLRHDVPSDAGGAVDAGGVADLPLGLDDGTGYTQVEVTLGRGDLLLFYTDALTEAVSPAGDMLGEDGLLDLVRPFDAGNPAAMPAALVAGLDAFRGGAAANDDATFLLLHHNAGPARPPKLLDLPGIYAKAMGLRPV